MQFEPKDDAGEGVGDFGLEYLDDMECLDEAIERLKEEKGGFP